jgi:hypothetical protein
MRFISRYGRFGVCLRPQIDEAYATGMAKVIQTPLYAFFHPYNLTNDERELALKTWGGSWNGAYQELDEATFVQPDYRIGVFDSHEGQATHSWSNSEREFVEEQLVAYANRWEDIIQVPTTFVEPPWPKYDEFKGTAQALVRKLVEEGHDLEQTLAYEQSVQNRAKVIEALNLAISDPETREALEPEEEEVVA